MSRQSCAVCAWRENGSVSVTGFSRDISIKDFDENTDKPTDSKESQKK